MCSWIFSATFHFPQTIVNTWVDGYGCSEFNLRQTNVNTWVDGYGCSEFNLRQTNVNTWVDGYECTELHSNTKTPAVSIGTSVHSHIGTSFGC